MYGEEVPLGRSCSSSRELDLEPGRLDPYVETPAGALQDIANKCGTKVLFAGEKIGEGIARTRREAQRQAAERSLMNLAEHLWVVLTSWDYDFADEYLSHLKPDSSSVHGEGSRYSNANDNGIIRDASSFGYHPLVKEESPLLSNASEPPWDLDPAVDVSKKSMGSISTLKELCMMEGLGVAFQSQPPPSANPLQKNEVYAQVEVDGQVLGKGIGLTWDEAKMQAAEKALGSLKSMLGQFSQKRQGSPR
ncbi:protein-serine,threonine phosphatase [Sarracenia purpurea var. burkii]